MRNNRVLFTAAVTTVVLGALAAAAAAAVVWGGLYDVSATGQHWQVTHSVLETAMRRSVNLRASGIEEPPLADERMALRGAACFRDTCVHCHGAPGVAPQSFGQASQPLPGPLLDARQHWRPRELYWLVKNGIRMSGMPAWEYHLADHEMWELVAFMQRLPELGTAGYAEWMQRAPPPPACGRERQAAAPVAAVDADRGRRALHQFGCNGCHIIPGVTGSRVHVGPPLEGIGSRKLVAGKLAGTPDNLALWIMRPQEVKPGSAMPHLGVPERDARDMAAYLSTLR
ncbi:MAG: c-type cytochrome [Burkholderiales bacterium]|nr:c-type cytochrome [Burkholderiales bacterium]